MKLVCEVCGTRFRTYVKWMVHLLDPSHQAKVVGTVWEWPYKRNDRSLVFKIPYLNVPRISLIWYFAHHAIVTEFVDLPDQVCVLELDCGSV